MMKPINKYISRLKVKQEFLYLNHLKSLINASNLSTHRVSIHIKINRPTSFAQKINVLQQVTTHLYWGVFIKKITLRST